MESLTMNETEYNPYLFDTYKECIICMESFNDRQKVTCLPCDQRHYFHSECILSWSERHRNCPLCKKVYDAKEIKKFNKKFVKLAKKADKERRSSILSSMSSQASISLETCQDEDEEDLIDFRSENTNHSSSSNSNSNNDNSRNMLDEREPLIPMPSHNRSSSSQSSNPTGSNQYTSIN